MNEKTQPENILFTSVLSFTIEQLCDPTLVEQQIALATMRLRKAIIDTQMTMAVLMAKPKPQAPHGALCNCRPAGPANLAPAPRPSTAIGQIQAALDVFTQNTGKTPSLCVLPEALFDIYQREQKQIAKVTPAAADHLPQPTADADLFADVAIYGSSKVKEIEVH